MKKGASIALMLSFILNICACGNSATKETESTTQDLIKVQRDDYETSVDAPQIESTTTSKKDEPSSNNPSITTATTTEKTTTASTTKPNKPTQPTDVEYDPKENVFNSTVSKNIDNSEMVLGDIVIKFDENGFKPYDLNDYITDDMITEEITSEDMSKLIADSLQTPTVEFISDYKFGEESYGFFRDNYYSSPYYNVLLEENELPVEKRKKREVIEYDEWCIDIPLNDKSDYEFKFKGIGLKTTETIGSVEAEEGYIKSPDLNTQFYIEVERDGYIINPQRIKNQSIKEDYSTSLKAIALKLGEIENVTSNGYAKISPILPITFDINNEKDKNDKFQLTLGMPYKTFIDKFGEGTKIAKDVTDEETKEVSEEAYYVYKTEDYTLIIQKSEYEEIEKPLFYNDDLPEKPELISTIILIRNVAIEQHTLAEETQTNE